MTSSPTSPTSPGTSSTGRFFEVTHIGAYIDSVVPPRCRKPRDVRVDVAVVIDIPAIRSCEAPVAFKVARLRRDGSDDTVDVRTWQGRLYRLRHAGNRTDDTPEAVIAGSDAFPAVVDVTNIDWAVWHGNLQAHLDALADLYSDLVIIDGAVWEPAQEPRYVLVTFGSGGNHGGTSLDVTHHDNTNVAASSYFRADQFEQARQCAVLVAQRRGDTDSIQALTRQQPGIDVLIPEAVRLVVPAAEPQDVNHLRTDLRRAVDVYSRHLTVPGAEDEAGLFDDIVSIRARLAQETDDIAGAGHLVRPFEDR